MSGGVSIDSPEEITESSDNCPLRSIFPVACSTAKQFSTLVTGQPIQTKLVSGVQTAGYCLFEGTFSQVPWGQARIITPDASETIWVIPGGIVYVELQPGRYR